MCEGCTNSLEKCVEGDDIYQEKCEMIMGCDIRDSEYTLGVHNVGVIYNISM